MIRRTFALLLFSLLISSPAWAAEPPDSPKGILGFAASLMDRGETYRAVTEYLRVVHHFGDDKEARETALKGLAAAYGKAGRWDDAAETLAALAAEYPNSDYMEEEARALYLAGRYGEAATLALKPGAGEKLIILGTLSLLKGGFADPTGLADRKLLEEYGALPQKSPLAAGVLSAILPGAGHLYVDRPNDALMAFLLNGAFIWGTIEAAEREQWGLAGLLGTVELFWYSGTIVGSVNGAHKWNNREKDRFLTRKETDALSGIYLKPLPGGAAIAAVYRW